MDDHGLLALVCISCDLFEVGSPWQVKHNVAEVLVETFIEVAERVWQHVGKIEDRIVGVVGTCLASALSNSGMNRIQLTAPRRTSEDDGILGQGFEATFHLVKDIAVDPEDLSVHTVNLGVVSRALQRLLVFLDCEDLFPAAREGELDDIAAGSGERVDEYCLACIGRGHMLSNLSVLGVRMRVK